MFVFILFLVFYFFFKQKTAYEVRISDWSSDVCSSDLLGAGELDVVLQHGLAGAGAGEADDQRGLEQREVHRRQQHMREAVEREKAEGDAEYLDRFAEIGRAQVCTPVTNAHPVCALRLEQKYTHDTHYLNSTNINYNILISIYIKRQ